jgi:hypothetical protein
MGQGAGFLAQWQTEIAGASWMGLRERQAEAEQERQAEAQRQHEQRLRRQHEERQERDRVWGVRRNELEAAAKAAQDELRYCRGRLAADDPAIRREAAMEIGALERLAEQAAEDLAAWKRQVPWGF